MKINITPHILIDENEFEYHFTKASGPGGQHVNKTATAVQLRFDVENSPSLPDRVRRRLYELAGNRINQEGVLIVEDSHSRSQWSNRQAARRRLVELLRKAARPQPKRRKTRPPRSARERRLRNKRHRAEKKRYRKPPREY